MPAAYKVDGGQNFDQIMREYCPHPRSSTLTKLVIVCLRIRREAKQSKTTRVGSPVISGELSL